MKRAVLIWFGGTTTFGLALALPLSAATQVPFGSILFVTLTAAYLIAGATTLLGRFLVSRALANKTDTGHWRFWFVITTGTALAGLTASVLCFVLYRIFLPHEFFALLIERAWLFFVVTLLLNTIAAPTFTFIDLRVRKDGTTSGRLALADGLKIQTRGRDRIVPLSAILYLSAAGRKTVIHTYEEDIEVPDGISSLVDRLPESFVQVHRSYVVHLAAIKEVRHDSGGQYSLTLNDEDDTMLPVSRKRVRLLRSKL